MGGGGLTCPCCEPRTSLENHWFGETLHVIKVLLCFLILLSLSNIKKHNCLICMVFIPEKMLVGQKDTEQQSCK